MAELQELARLLGAAHVPGPQMQQATGQLRALEEQAGFTIALIRLLENDSVDIGARLAAAIYFKNALRRRWGDDSFPDDERQAIKDGLLPLIFRSPKPVRLQLLATLEELSRPGWLAEWPGLLPALCQSVAEAGSDVLRQTLAMDVVHTVFRGFRRPGGGSMVASTVRESRCCTESFGPCHLEVWKQACERVLSQQCPVEQRSSLLELLASSMKVFHDLHFQVLPDFFSANSEVYLEGFLALLNLRSSGTEAEVEPLRTLQVEICCVLALFGGGYEEEHLGPRAQPCLEAVCRRALEAGAALEEDDLVTACLRFLQSLTSSVWSQSPLAQTQTLQAVCEHILLPNLQLRPGDLETFYESPSDWLTLDADGGDAGSRRSAVVELVRSIRRRSGEEGQRVYDVLSGLAGQLLSRATAAAAGNQAAEAEAEAVLCLDACLHAVLGLCTCTASDDSRAKNLAENFFLSHVGPELQASHLSPKRAVFRASCIKFVSAMRSMLPIERVVEVCPAICRHLTSDNPVVHTWAATALAQIGHLPEAIQWDSRFGQEGPERKRQVQAALASVFREASEPMLRILLERRGILGNSYISRSLVSLWVVVGPCQNDVQSLMLLAKIIDEVLIPQPPNPDFAQDLFEGVAVLIKHLVSMNLSPQECLMPVLGKIWDQQIEDLVCHCYQILALLLDLSSNLNDKFFLDLLSTIVRPELWSSPANAQGIVRLLRSYFAKYRHFAEPLRGALGSIVGCFHKILTKQKTTSVAFYLLNAMVRYLPPEYYEQYYPACLNAILEKLELLKRPAAIESSEFEKEVAVHLSLFVYMQPNPQVLPTVLNAIRPGSFSTILERTLVGCGSKVLLLQRRKVCLVGVARLMTSQEVCNSPDALRLCADFVGSMLTWRNAGLLSWLSAVVMPHVLGNGSQQAEMSEYEPAFARLHQCEVDHSTKRPHRGWDMLPELKDKACGVAVVRELLSPLQGHLQSGLGPHHPLSRELWPSEANNNNNNSNAQGSPNSTGTARSAAGFFGSPVRGSGG